MRARLGPWLVTRTAGFGSEPRAIDRPTRHDQRRFKEGRTRALLAGETGAAARLRNKSDGHVRILTCPAISTRPRRSARASSAADTDWTRIAALYAALGHVAPSPIVELNRAVAVSMAFGPALGLAIVDPLCADPALFEYPFLPSVRADLLAKLGRFAEARSEVERAASLTKNARDRALFLERAAAYARQHG